jgi:serine/threonine protein kinase
MCSSEGAEVLWHQIKLDSSPLPLLKSRGIDLATLLAINHRNLLRLRDAWFDSTQQTFHYITEFPPPQTLRAYMSEFFGTPSESVLIRWCYDILGGLDALHRADPPIIHRALSCDNIFIDPGDGLIKIGLPAIELAIFGRPNPFAGPADDLTGMDPKSDIWLFGLCMIEIATGEICYSEFGTDEARRRREINERQMPRAFSGIHDPNIADLIMTCLGQPKGQPTAGQLRENPLFMELNSDPGSGRSRVSEVIEEPEPSALQELLSKQAREKSEMLARHHQERVAYRKKIATSRDKP